MNRRLSTIAGACLQFRHYRAAKNMVLRYESPLDALARYLFASGSYPVRLRVRTPLGPIEPTLYTYHDMLTLNEIFCRGDYRSSHRVRIVVDFGSNIGISGLYFLTQNPKAFVYLFEPLPRNAERLHQNLRGFEGRYEFSPIAVALSDGKVEFGYEASGRYGGIGLAREEKLLVHCRSANEILHKILDKHGEIDVLKIDIEVLEKDILLSISIDMLRRIKEIFVEVEPMFITNPLPLTHQYRRYGNVARFRRKTLEG